MVLETVEEALGGTHVQHLLVVLGLKWDRSMILFFHFGAGGTIQPQSF